MLITVKVNQELLNLFLSFVVLSSCPGSDGIVPWHRRDTNHCKRIVLTGQPSKSHKKTVSERCMFLTPSTGTTFREISHLNSIKIFSNPTMLPMGTLLHMKYGCDGYVWEFLSTHGFTQWMRYARLFLSASIRNSQHRITRRSQKKARAMRYGN